MNVFEALMVAFVVFVVTWFWCDYFWRKRRGLKPLNIDGEEIE